MFVGALSPEFEALSIEALKSTTVEEMVACIVDKLQLPPPLDYELAEVGISVPSSLTVHHNV